VGDALCLDLLHATDPVAFAVDRLGFTPDPWQAALMRSPSKRIALNCSRQSGKSTSAAVLAVHTAVYDPGALILLVSPSARQSKELFAKTASLLKMLQPVQALEEDNRLSCSLTNGSRIVSLPGDAKTIRGYSAPSLVIEDEAAFVDDELHVAIRPMLAVSDGRLIIMSTPFGRRGHFFDAWTQPGDAWHRISVPASSCPRISAEFLATERAGMTAWRFRQEYECEFVETQDQVFGYDLIRAAFDPAISPLFTPGQLALLGASSAMQGASA
jgi:hypothetical protein